MPSSSEHFAVSAKESRWPFWFVLSFAGAIRFYDLGGKQLWVDEIMQAMWSSPRLLKDVLRAVTDGRGATPLDYVVQHYVTRVLGQSEFSLRLHAALFGTLTIAAVYSLMRMLFGRRVALVTSALYAVYPLHHHYSQEGRPYALFTLLTVCSYLIFWKLLSSGEAGDWLCYVVITALLFYSHYYGVFVVFSQLAFSCLLLSPRVQGSLPETRKVDSVFLVKLAGAAATSAALFVPWILFGVHTIRGYTPAPEQFGFKLFLRFLKELSDRSYPLSVVLIVLAMLGIWKLRSEAKYGHLWFLLCWGLLPVPFIFLLLWIKDYFFAVRQILFATPALFALVSLGISYLSEKLATNKTQRPAVTAWLVAGVGAISLIVIGLHVPDRREDLRGAAQFLQRNVLPGDIVIAPKVDGLLGYYFPQIGTHLQPTSVLADPGRIVLSNRKAFIIGTQYMSGADRRWIDVALGNSSSRRRITLREVDIIELGERR